MPKQIMMMICPLLAFNLRSVTQNYGKWLISMPFFLVLIEVGFVLDVLFLFFFDALTLRESNILINKELEGVKIRRQNSVIWFLLTLTPHKAIIYIFFLTPLIINELTNFSVRWRQIKNY